MRLVSVHGGVLRISWTWLPLWLALNPGLQEAIGERLRDAALLSCVVVGDGDLAAMHDWVRDQICTKFNIPGLREYLDALKLVDME